MRIHCPSFSLFILSLCSDKGHRHSASMYSGRNNNARDLFDAELQRAIQLSLQEVGASSASTKRPGYVPYQPQPYSEPSEPPIVDRTTYPDKDRRKSAPPAAAIADDDDDPDLRAAIEASLREANMVKPSAPTEMVSADDVGRPSSYPPTVTPTPSVPKIPNYDLEPLESDVILTFSQTVEQVQSQGGRDMSRYPAVSELFDKANGLRPKLAMSLDDTGRKERRCSFHSSMFIIPKFVFVTFQLQNSWARCTTNYPKRSNSTINYSQIRSPTRLGVVHLQNGVARRRFLPDPRMSMSRDQTDTINGLLRSLHTHPELRLKPRNRPPWRPPSNHHMPLPRLRCRARRGPRTPTLHIPSILPLSKNHITR